jgi:predicted Zn-dependent protease
MNNTTDFHLARRTTLLLVIAFLVSSCAVNPVTGEQDLVLMSEEQELSLGRSTHGEILQEYGEYKNSNLAKYVQKVGDRVAKSSHRPDLLYRFTVLDSPQVNAFALPGGYIYVTRGILSYLNTEDDLAAVLAHEIGHVTARHAVRQHSTSTLTSVAGAILASQAGVQGAGDIANILGTALVRGYGREHELEADRLGAEYLVRAGYDPDAMLNVIRVLKDQEQFEAELARLEKRDPRSYHGLFSTHPDNDRRLQSIIQASKKIRPTKDMPGKGEGNYLEMIDGITFGSSAGEGVIRGQQFYHQELDFTLTFPDGWRIKNRPERVVATSASNDGMMVLTVHERNRRITPQQFMRKRLELNNLSSGEEFQHHGLQGYTAITPTDTEYGERPARVIVFYYGKRAYVIAGVAKNPKKPYQYDGLFLKSGQSFRALEENEKLQGEARKLVVMAYDGRPYNELAKQSGLSTLAESQIRLLNGHYPKGKPAPGSLIKTIE